jgi:SAM-dependent methyltransferase
MAVARVPFCPVLSHRCQVDTADMPMPPSFTAHNIVLDDGRQTKPDAPPMSRLPWFVSAAHLLSAFLPGSPKQYRIADLGCCEGGYAVEFARLGYEVLGIDIRQANIAACDFVKSAVDLPHLHFVQDDVRNLRKYGKFDAIFCCGLLYHLEKPIEFIHLLSDATLRVLILNTHFATDDERQVRTYNLSAAAENEGALGRWYTEYPEGSELAQLQADARWSSWDNSRSFWLEREYILQAMRASGFDLTLEEFGAADIVHDLKTGYYRSDGRGTFVGWKSPLNVDQPTVTQR